MPLYHKLNEIIPLIKTKQTNRDNLTETSF